MYNNFFLIGKQKKAQIMNANDKHTVTERYTYTVYKCALLHLQNGLKG